MKREITLIALGIVFIAIGVFSLMKHKSSSLPLERASAIEESFSESPSPSYPSWINIKKSNITAQVAAGGYKDGKWILDSDYVLYLPTSARLGQGGNTILYAHSREKLFGNLKKTSIGDQVILGDANGKMYSYKIYSVEYIKPYEIEKINTGAKDTVTLFTCDGWFDEKRLVVKAFLLL